MYFEYWHRKIMTAVDHSNVKLHTANTIYYKL